ncbi:MAG TPA: hypothetical protein VFS62_16940 [Chloroflexota bacterium]|jgi:hypothetical protein|nr:hypothetical protein [Chloroflexota bacterium]
MTATAPAAGATTIILRCEVCGRDFDFPEAERLRLRALRRPSPRRCSDCRVPTAEQDGSLPVPAICADCGEQFELAVRPSSTRTRFYCETCFGRRVQARYGGGRSGNRLG